ncbi:hypothetical protein E5676_scaffold11G00800 [Cucumis melo var. makuwa]|uniref:Uncharacterized protein n=1 Tax=Cucumis melo var. makuwa TaxID=1194695 RepID=A0A5D3BVS6_CUCMM|nr:hypothetical protein E6C27_scaffold186G00320 [Cucumis melo var. makuwa]TYK03175.1 hypothetical protein E5676_scaffold11G00800 [Cucumis melo var. makuwa]
MSATRWAWVTRPCPSTKGVIADHLISQGTSTLKPCSQQGASIIQASSSKCINSTSSFHSLPHVKALHSGQALPLNRE